MLPGETILSGGPDTCEECGTKLKFEVMNSQAGYYVGTYCCYGPYTRETGYFQSKEKADRALDLINKGLIMDPRAKVRL